MTNSYEERVVSKCAYVLFYQRRRTSESLRQPLGNQSVPTTFAKPSSSVSKEEDLSYNHKDLPSNERPESSTHRTTEEKCSVSEENRPLNNGHFRTYETNQTEEKDKDSKSQAPNISSDSFTNGDSLMKQGMSSSTHSISTGDSSPHIDQSDVDESELD